ncbi:hypothetical protein AKJ16_DCAP02878 [Drosera capensis]
MEELANYPLTNKLRCKQKTCSLSLLLFPEGYIFPGYYNRRFRHRESPVRLYYINVIENLFLDASKGRFFRKNDS